MIGQICRFALACVSLLLIAGCVPIPPQRPAPTPTIMPALVTSRAQATTVPLQVYATSERTGITQVDRVIDAMLDADRSALRGLIRFLTAPCTTREGLGGPPKCGPGETDGTPVEAFPVGGPEGTFVRPVDIDRLLPGQMTGLYAVYRVPASAYRESYWPAGDYGVVFLRPDNSFLIARVDEAGIVRLDFPPVSSPDGLSGWIGPEMVLPPREP